MELIPNTLYYGDCLEVMAGWPDACVDLVYLDPPFNSNVNYNILFPSSATGALPSSATGALHPDKEAGPAAKSGGGETGRRRLWPSPTPGAGVSARPNASSS